MYILNKYTTTYYAIVDKARSKERSRKDDYFERHHIIPKSLGGSNDASNLVLLTAREHFIAHWLLTKMTEGVALKKMQQAMYFTVYGNKGQAKALSARHYERAKLEMSELAKTRKNCLGQKWTPEQRQRMSDAHKKRLADPAEREKLSQYMMGHKPSDETKRKQSEALKRGWAEGRRSRQKPPLTETQRANLSAAITESWKKRKAQA